MCVCWLFCSSTSEAVIARAVCQVVVLAPTSCPRDRSIVEGTHVLLLGADLKSTLQLPIPCYTSTSHITDNHYLSHHPLVPFFLCMTGNILQRPKGRHPENILISQHRSLEYNPVPKPDIAGDLRAIHLLSTHIPLDTLFCNPSLLTLLLQQIILCDTTSSPAKHVQNELEQRQLHLRPSRPSRRRMPALAIHISAPNLLLAPTTSIPTDLRFRSK